MELLFCNIAPLLAELLRLAPHHFIEEQGEFIASTITKELFAKNCNILVYRLRVVHGICNAT